MGINYASEALGASGGAPYGIPLEDFSALADNAFAQNWKERFQIMRVQQIPNIARWLKVLHYFHPRSLEDHWQDQFGMPLPKLADSEGLSVTIWNYCRPIIETYGSLIAGHKPWPFYLDVRPSDAKVKSERFRAQAQEDIFQMEMEHMKVPLHFMDFASSVMLFGIGWVSTWIDPRSRRMKLQAFPWPGDVLCQWGSNWYGQDEEAIESLIITENIPTDTALRRWPKSEFVAGLGDMAYRPDAGSNVFQPSGQTQILKVWYRWNDEREKAQIGMAEIAYNGQHGGAEVLSRKDKTGYPDIPFRWSSRFMTPGEAPDKAAGVLDDMVGVNTEFDERMSAFSDLIMKFVFPKLKGKNYNSMTIPKVSAKQNVIPLGLNQDLQLIQDIIAGGQEYFDSWIAHSERFMLMNVGLSSLLMGSTPPGETSGKALEYLIHASIGRLEIVRTPIQWAWLSLFQEIAVPLMYKYGKFSVKDAYTGKATTEDMKTLFDNFSGFSWTWPDVTPESALTVLQGILQQREAGLMADETAIERLRNVGSALDELEKVRQDKADKVLHPDAVMLTNQVDQQKQAFDMSMQQQAMMMSAPAATAETGPGMGPGSAPPTGPKDQAVADAQNKAKARGTPSKTTSDNARPPVAAPPRPPVRQGSPANAAQGVRGTPGAK